MSWGTWTQDRASVTLPEGSLALGALHLVAQWPIWPISNLDSLSTRNGWMKAPLRTWLRSVNRCLVLRHPKPALPLASCNVGGRWLGRVGMLHPPLRCS